MELLGNLKNTKVKKFQIKSFCKINLSLKVIKKLNSGFHKIMSLITFCSIHDTISISQINSQKDKIEFSGKFKIGIYKKNNTLTKMFDLLRNQNLLKNEFFKINVKKNIPHGSGLGGGSSNAAYLLNFLNSKFKLSLTQNSKEQLARKIGSDVPIILEKKNSFLTGKKNEILRINRKFRLNLLIIYPNLRCSTKTVYNENTLAGTSKQHSKLYKINNKKLISSLKDANNDLERAVINIYPKVKKIIDYIKTQKGCYFSRITGSGSACIGIFSNMKNAIKAKKMIKKKYPKYWCIVSKTI